MSNGPSSGGLSRAKLRKRPPTISPTAGAATKIPKIVWGLAGIAAAAVGIIVSGMFSWDSNKGDKTQKRNQEVREQGRQQVVTGTPASTDPKTGQVTTPAVLAPREVNTAVGDAFRGKPLDQEQIWSVTRPGTGEVGKGKAKIVPGSVTSSPDGLEIRAQAEVTFDNQAQRPARTAGDYRIEITVPKQ